MCEALGLVHSTYQKKKKWGQKSQGDFLFTVFVTLWQSRNLNSKLPNTQFMRQPHCAVNEGSQHSQQGTGCQVRQSWVVSLGLASFHTPHFCCNLSLPLHFTRQTRGFFFLLNSFDPFAPPILRELAFKCCCFLIRKHGRTEPPHCFSF